MSTQTTIDSNELFIGGDWTEPLGEERISVLSASTEEPIGSVPEGTNADIDAAVRAARAAFDDPSGWSSWSAEDRAQALERFAGALESRGEEAARRVSRAERHADLLRTHGGGGLPRRCSRATTRG